MTQRYAVTWGYKDVVKHTNGVSGFGSINAAQQFIMKICKKIAPDMEYRWVQEF